MNGDIIPTNRRTRFAIWATNKLLWTLAPDYSKIIAGIYEYGMRSAVRDQLENRDYPDDWRTLLEDE